MTIQNSKYYHIQRPGLGREVWYKGQQKQTSKKIYNPFYSEILRDSVDRVDLNGESIGLIKYSNQIFKEDKNINIKSQANDFEELYFEFQNNSIEYESLADKLHRSLFQYLKWIREEVFENTRVEIDNKLPSRRHCIWVCTEKELPKWWHLFKTNKENKILELKLGKKGRLHKGDGTFIESETYTIEEYKSVAKKYWSGELNSIDEIEFSYEGEFKIINEFNDINQLIK